MRSGQVLALALLSAALLFQLRSLGGDPAMVHVDGPEHGARLPAFDVTDIWQGDTLPIGAFVPHGECALLVFISADCAFCKRLRVTQWRSLKALNDSLGASLRVAWIGYEEPNALRRFAGDFLPQEVPLLAFSSARREWVTRLGIVGTPASLLVDGMHRVRRATLGPSLPPAAVVREWCDESAG